MAKLNAKKLVQQLRALHGNVAAAAKNFGVSRQAVMGFISRRPKLQEILKECRETMKDNVESALYSQALHRVLAGQSASS